MRNSFPLFQSHLDLAHTFWKQLVHIGDTVIDATCGNGYDTLKLCELALAQDKGRIYSFDIQEQAINSTQLYLASHLSLDLQKRVILRQGCHSAFSADILSESVKLIVYNLGYLPGGNKNKTTERFTTLQSVHHAQTLLQPGGMISITCYPGHLEGEKEQKDLLVYASTLSPKEWSCCHHQWNNRLHSPTLLLIQKANR